MNARLRKVTRPRALPNRTGRSQGAVLAVRNLQESRRPTVGIRSSGWKQAMQAFTIYFRGTHPHHMTATITYTDTLTGPHEEVRDVLLAAQSCEWMLTP